MSDLTTNRQDLIKIAFRMQGDGRYVAVGHDGKTLWSNSFHGLEFARRYTADCSTWVIVEDYEVIEQSEETYADYPGGADRYAADVTILTNPIVLNFDATTSDYSDELDAEELAGLYQEYTEAAGRFMPYALSRLKGTYHDR